MKFTTRLSAVLVMFPVTFALNAVRADDNGAALKADPGTEHATEIYSHICQGCHMPKGQGAIGAGHYPALAGDPALASWQYVAITVLRGRRNMPAFGLSADQAKQTRAVRLDDAEVADIVNYVRHHFGNHYKNTITAQDIEHLPHPETEGGLE